MKVGSSMTTCLDLPRGKRGRCKRTVAKRLQESWLEELVWSADPQRSWQVQCWLGVFPVHWRQLPDPSFLNQQIASIRTCLDGSYEELLVAMVQDPALQISLNGLANHRRKPNENFARELLELFTVGAGGFSEQDVSEAARALTGFRMNASRQLVLKSRRHDGGLKTILGRSDRFDPIGLVRWLTQQPSTAKHIAFRVWRQVIGTVPSPVRLDQLAHSWQKQDLSIPWLMDTLLSSSEAEISLRKGHKLADPLEMVSRSLRLIGSRHQDALSVTLKGLKAMGQSPFEPPNVGGWPVNEGWLNVRWLHARKRTLRELIRHEEIWSSRTMSDHLDPSLTARPPLTMSLPAPSSRDNVMRLLLDPVWQLS